MSFEDFDGEQQYEILRALADWSCRGLVPVSFEQCLL